MNPVVGLDVAKGESQVQALLDQSKPYGTSFSMKQHQRGIRSFFRLFKRD
ncbi:hypothetical protein J7E95_05055 [Streptomyces sp. ISL-14]|nr:hypothetical protein [Bacillus sp. ISL-4]MBT2670175.1 hypothetical protein [Streptomyces sp. ISL-14]